MILSRNNTVHQLHEIILVILLITVKLGYNEHHGTIHICSLYP